MKRIAIIGSSGSGKSTLARQLGEQLNLPVYHLDQYYWNAGWQPAPRESWQQTVERLAKNKQWIIDGNNRRTLDVRLGRADTVIFLDLPRWVSIMRASKRRFQYIRHQRPDIAAGCREPILHPSFPRFLHWIWQYNERARPDVVDKITSLNSQTRVLWFTSQHQIDKFMQDPYGYTAERPNLGFYQNFYNMAQTNKA